MTNEQLAHELLFDPVFTPTDVEVFTRRRLAPITRTASDRYMDAPTERPTFFFMPHCEAVLYERLLRAHWGTPAALRGHAVLGNNFGTYVERWAHRAAGAEGCPRHVLAAAPLVAAAGPIGVDPAGTFLAAAAVGAFNDTSVQQVIGGVLSGAGACAGACAGAGAGEHADGQVVWLPLPEVA